MNLERGWWCIFVSFRVVGIDRHRKGTKTPPTCGDIDIRIDGYRAVREP
jgi:hypothetical protein